MDQISQVAYLIPHYTIASFVSFKQHAHCNAMLRNKILDKAVFGPPCSNDHNEISNGQIRWFLHNLWPVSEVFARHNCLVVEAAEVLESLICIVIDSLKGSFVIFFRLESRKHEVSTSYYLCFWIVHRSCIQKMSSGREGPLKVEEALKQIVF